MVNKMFDSRKQNPNCNFAEEVVSYVYDEMNIAEKADFQTHLAECSSCVDEIAAFSSVSFSIKEWRDEEFAGLKTPQISIPYETNGISVSVEAYGNNKGSIFEKLSELLSFSPAFLKTATAFGTLALAIGLAWFLMASPNNENQSLATKDKKETKEEISTPIKSGKAEESVQPEIVDNENTEPEIIENVRQPEKVIAVATPKIDRQRTVVDKKVLKVKNTSNRKNNSTRDKNKPELKPIQKNKNLDQTDQEYIDFQEIPRLTDFAMDESEEKELRLTDLFDDGESGD